MPSKFFLFVMMLFALNCGTGSAQKAFKPVKSALKDKKYADAMKAIQTLRKDSLWANHPQLTIFSIEAYKGLNDAENMKLYLKRSYDTLAFFSTTLQIVKESMQLDSIERAQANNGGKRKNRKYVAENIQKYFPNLNAGARFLYKKGKYAEAIPYFETILDLPHTPVGQETKLPIKAESTIAALQLICAFNAKAYDHVERYTSLALSDSISHPFVLRCLAMKSEATSDTAAYRKWLETGLKGYPQQPFFFVHLADYHLSNNRYKVVMRLSENMLEKDSTNYAALLARCNASFHLSDYEQCISSAKQLSVTDSTNADAYYYKGASYAALSEQITMPDNINSAAYRKALQQRKSYALLAEPDLEKYRELMPKEQKRWAPLLYQVYLVLNRGKKFAEIDNLMQGVKPQWPKQ